MKSIIWGLLLATASAAIATAQDEPPAESPPPLADPGAGAPSDPATAPDEAATGSQPQGSSRDELFVCLVDGETDEGTLDCVSSQGDRQRFPIGGDADPGAESSERKSPPSFASAARMQGPAFLTLATGALIGLALGAAWAVRRRKPAQVRAARSFLRSLQATKPIEPRGNALDRFEDLVERANAEPLNAGAQFELAMELFDHDQTDLGLRSLDRAVHLAPEVLLVFLNDPRYAKLRGRDDVRMLLKNVWRDSERRLAGYA